MKKVTYYICPLCSYESTEHFEVCPACNNGWSKTYSQKKGVITMPGIPELPPIELMKIEAERRKAERRERCALAVLPALIITRLDRNGFGPAPEFLATAAVRFADALIAELDK